MAFYDREAHTEVVTVAILVGLGSVLVQERQEVKRVVDFASRSLSDNEGRYGRTAKEAIAVVRACEIFQLYLSGLESLELVFRATPSARFEWRHEVCRCWKTGDWSTALSPYRLLRDEINTIGRLVMRGMQYFSANLRKQMLEFTHEGHQRIVTAKDGLRSKVWWPSKNSMVERRGKQC